MHLKKLLFTGILSILYLVIINQVKAQNIAITDDNTYSADNSAMLDVKSNTKGILIPRLTTSARNSITTPATGLMVYDTDFNEFFYFDGTNWIPLFSNKSGLAIDVNSSLFAILNSAGDTVFAVYPEGVRINVGNGIAKGTRGGFAVGGLSSGGKVGAADYLTIQDSTIRMYVADPASKGARGGFAVGGLSSVGKVTPVDFLNLTPKNYFIGHQSGSSILGGLYNTFLGFESGLNTSGGNSNIFIGRRSGYSVTNGDYNVYIGDSAGFTNSLGNDNIFIGYNAGLSSSGGYNNVYMGKEAGYANSSGHDNIFMGYRAGYNSSGGFNNVVIGKEAGFHITTGQNNVLIGNYAGDSLKTGLYNVAIGTDAGRSNKDGDYNTMIGYLAGYSNTVSYNTMIGYNAGYNSITSDNQTFIGYRAGFESTGIRNTFVGGESGYHTGGGSYNVYLGTAAGQSNSSDNNVFLGYFSGISSSGSGNVFIGSNSGYSETASNKLIIENSSALSTGALIYGDFSTDDLRFNANVGIGKDASTYALDVSGDVNASGSFKVNGTSLVSSQWTTTGSDIYFNTGSIGIGSIPNSKLHVNATSGNLLRLQTSGSTKFFVSGDGGTTIGTFEDSPPAGGLYVSGNTGIGVAAPSTKLHVKASINSTATLANHVAIIENTSTGTSPDVLALKIGYTGSPTTAINFITFFKGGDVGIGAIEGNGSGGITLNTSAADYAEFIPKYDENELFEKGDIIGIKAGKVTKNTKNADLIMAISSAPIVLGNNPGKENEHLYEKVGFIGQVDVKVRGKVKAGDYILASGNNDGTGIAKNISEMNANDFGNILGIAWESSEIESEKIINVGIGVDSWTLPLKQQQQQIDQLSKELQEIKDILNANTKK